MSPEENALLCAEFTRDSYANAFLFHSLIITAAHVAQNGMFVRGIPHSPVDNRYDFYKAPRRDLAVSQQYAPSRGFEDVATPQLHEHVRVLGYHGAEKEHFQIEARVRAITSTGRIELEHLSGKLFQLGMSGSVALNDRGQVLGVLVGDADNPHGKGALLEPATALFETR